MVLRIPEKYRDYIHRAEKGLDMQLSCDALTLVANKTASCIGLYINDRDYIPFIKSIKNLGANVYLTCLSSKYPIQEKLCDISDKFLSQDNALNRIFNIQTTEVTQQ